MITENWQCRTELLLGGVRLEALKTAHVMVVGLGGVGGYAAEQLGRAGIGKLTLVDSDIVQPSNRNRQIIALSSTVGQYKTKLIGQRLKDINPEIQIEYLTRFIDENNIAEILEGNYTYIVDAIDTLSPKVALLTEALQRDIKVISSMGSAGRTNPAMVQVTDISLSHHCRFAFMVRKYLHQRGITKGIKVVFSPEVVNPLAIVPTDGSGNKRSIVGTISYMPAIFGCFCAAEIIMDIIGPCTKIQ